MGETFLKNTVNTRDALSDLTYLLNPYQIAVAQTLVKVSFQSLQEQNEGQLVNHFITWCNLPQSEAD